MTAGRTSIVTIFLDVVEAAAYGILLALSAPLSVLRTHRLKKITCYLRVLTPHGLLPLAAQALYDMRRDEYKRAGNSLDALVGSLEEFLDEKRGSKKQMVLVLTDLYALLAQTHLRRGNLSSAAVTVIRAHRCLGLERLPGLREFDARTAHIYKAALAASKLAAQSHLMASPRKPSHSAGGAGAVATLPVPSAKIIPFPRSAPLNH